MAGHLAGSSAIFETARLRASDACIHERTVQLLRPRPSPWQCIRGPQIGRKGPERVISMLCAPFPERTPPSPFDEGYCSHALAERKTQLVVRLCASMPFSVTCSASHKFFGKLLMACKSAERESV